MSKHRAGNAADHPTPLPEFDLEKHARETWTRTILPSGDLPEECDLSGERELGVFEAFAELVPIIAGGGDISNEALRFLMHVDGVSRVRAIATRSGMALRVACMLFQELQEAGILTCIGDGSAT